MQREHLTIIEVGVNEMASKEDNSHVPYTADEVVASAVEAVEAGASVVHFHARSANGDQAWADDKVCRSVCEAMHDYGDVPTYPSYFNDDYSHIYQLAAGDDGAWQLEMTPFDPAQAVQFSLWNPVATAFEALQIGDVVAPAYPPSVDRFRELGLVANVGIFSSADLRWTVYAVQAGLIAAPVNLKFFFSDTLLTMNEPTSTMLDSLLAQIPPSIAAEVIVVPYMMHSPEQCDELWNAAVERGLGVRAGIGDCPLTFAGFTNADMVKHVVDIVVAHGGAPASVAEARNRMGLKETINA